MSRKKLRPMGEILLDIELILDEMVDGHGLQTGDILALIKTHIDVHLPHANEEYEEGGRPVFKYEYGGKL